jgi:hypothetical protein
VASAPGGVPPRPNIQVTPEFRAAFQSNDVRALAQEVARQCPFLSGSAVGGYVDFIMGTKNGRAVSEGVSTQLSLLQTRIKNQPTA